MTLIMVIVQLSLLLLTGPVWAQSRGHLGVFIQNASRISETGEMSIREGVVVLGLMRNSPAEQGGMQRGDVIIASMGSPCARWKICNGLSARLRWAISQRSRS